MENHPPPLIHVVDDEASLRRALVFLLESAGWRVAAHESAETFLAARTEPMPPGCLILDIRMPRLSGLELQRILNERAIRLPVIFLTGHADVSIAVQAMKLGACELIEKPFKDQVLLDAVGQAVRADLAQRDEYLARQALRARLDRLSPREMAVARLIVAGLPNKAIGQRLEISERTVQVHRLHVMEKLGIHSAAELTQLVLKADRE
ncbi:MAG: response regulator transcription factor [Sulfuritalea sp.]|nr:response regulator transcription factor [Sulfuritalea sp.]